VTKFATARVLWVTVAVILLGWAELAFDGTVNWDGEEVLLYVGLALGFPSAILGAALLAGLYEAIHSVTGTTIVTSRLEMAFAWAVLVACGYLQWFVIVPAIARRLRGRFASVRETSN